MFPSVCIYIYSFRESSIVQYTFQRGMRLLRQAEKDISRLGAPKMVGGIKHAVL